MTEKQEFTTYDSISLFVLLAICIGIITYICIDSFQVDKREIARHRAEKYALQILQFHRSNKGLLNNRGPASVDMGQTRMAKEGRIGMDPWGKAFYFQIVSKNVAEDVVVVLSSGPNRNLDSDRRAIEIEADGASWSDMDHDDIVIKRRI